MTVVSFPETVTAKRSGTSSVRLPKFVSTVSGQLSCTASQPDRSTVKSPKLASILPLRSSGVTTGTRQEPKLSSQLRWPLSQCVFCVNFPP